MPAQPVHVLPLRERHPRLHLGAHVGLGELAELVHAEGVHQVLEARVRPHLAVAVVALGREDRLEALRDVLLVHVPEVVRHTREGGLLVVRAPHTAAHHHVVPHEGLAILGHDHHQADVVDVDIHRVVARDGHRDLELAREVRAAVKRLVRIAGDDPVSVVVHHGGVDAGVELLEGGGEGRDVVHARRALHQILAEVLDGGGLLAVEPELREGVGSRLEQLADEVGGLVRVLVRRVGEGHRGRHHVAVDVAAPAEGRAAGVGDVRDDLLEVLLLHAVDLPRHAGGGAEILLPVLGGAVVEGLVRLRGHLPARVLEAKHELERVCVPGLVGPLEVAVLLLVGAVVLEHHHRLVRQLDRLLVSHLLQERESKVARVLFNGLGLVLVELEVVVRQLHPGILAGRLGAHELPRREPGGRVAFRRCDHAGPGGRRLGASRVRQRPGHARHRRKEARGEGIRARGEDGRSGNRRDDGSPRRDDHRALNDGLFRGC
mmetsp:Transcript_20738/g.48026  ORF Transcript_20738/g.48026 Transcript_20738/m.48026 type:complete len:489 (+) Transcript_20738:966-2432(+)